MKTRPWMGALGAAVLGLAGCNQERNEYEYLGGVEPNPEEEGFAQVDAREHPNYPPSDVGASPRDPAQSGPGVGGSGIGRAPPTRAPQAPMLRDVHGTLVSRDGTRWTVDPGRGQAAVAFDVPRTTDVQLDAEPARQEDVPVGAKVQARIGDGEGGAVARSVQATSDEGQ